MGLEPIPEKNKGALKRLAQALEKGADFDRF